jgi:hypothetical protein
MLNILDGALVGMARCALPKAYYDADLFEILQLLAHTEYGLLAFTAQTSMQHQVQSTGVADA